MIPRMYLPLERNNDEERPDPLSKGFFPTSVIPYLPKKNLKQNPFKTTKKQDEFEHIQMKKKKNSAMQFKIGDLDELPFEQFFMSILSQAYTVYI